MRAAESCGMSDANAVAVAVAVLVTVVVKCLTYN